MDWENRSWTSRKSFKQHVQFMFDGSLKKNDEEERYALLMLWVGEKREKLISDMEIDRCKKNKKKKKLYYNGFEA